MTEPIFELKNVSYSYLGKFPALTAIDLAINKGKKIAVIGANGTGKSTLLALLDGLIFPDQGAFKAFGKELNESVLNDRIFSRSFHSKVGFVFQNPDIQLFCPTVKEDILFGPLQLGVSKEEAKNRLGKLSEFLNIQDLLERAPHQLSIGEKRKAALAAVLAIEPEVLLLDEPTAGLDPLTTRHIIDLILEASAAGKTIVTSTHDLHIVAEISDTVHVFDRSKSIIKSGNPQEVLNDEEFLLKNNLTHIHRHKHKGVEHSHPHLHLPVSARREHHAD